MGRLPARVTAVVLCTGVLIGIAAGAGAAPLSDQERAERAVAYLASRQKANGAIVAFSPIGSTADAVPLRMRSVEEGCAASQKNFRPQRL